MTAAVELIGVAMGLGGPDTAAAAGPARLREADLSERLTAHGIVNRWSPSLLPRGPVTDRLRAATELNARIARRVQGSLRDGDSPLVIGGDHSIAAGTWRGVERALGRFGLVWIDAHMDAHTPATSPSGNPHGMPLASLLGAVDGAAALAPEDVALIGIRSYEEGEAALLKRLGVRVYYQAEVDERGIAAVLMEAIDRARRATGRYGLTLDLDAIDPFDAPGTGTRAAGGIAARELLPALTAGLATQNLVAAEIVEFAPKHDPRGRTLALALDLATTLAQALAAHRHA